MSARTVSCNVIFENENSVKEPVRAVKIWIDDQNNGGADSRIRVQLTLLDAAGENRFVDLRLTWGDARQFRDRLDLLLDQKPDDVEETLFVGDRS